MSAATRPRPVVLLVEDNPDDQELARLANRRLEQPFELVAVGDGIEALEYLDHALAPQEARRTPRPSLLLIDLAMPRMGGLALLERLRSDARYRLLPAVILTTSTAEGDLRRAYDRGCHSYIVKPMAIRELAEVFQRISVYWFGCVQLPT